MSFVTYTIRHHQGDNLKGLVKGLSAARERLRSGRGSQRFRDLFGLRGSIRALEATFGANGWHPHVHELLFHEGKVDLGELQSYLGDRWSSHVKTAGLADVNQHGLMVGASSRAAAEYVAKWGRPKAWNVDHELTKQVVKKGREGSQSPTDLLRSFAWDRNQVDAERWREYVRSFKGQRQLVWSPGLRKELLPEVPEVTDEELAADLEEFPVLLAMLTRAQWRVVVEMGARAQVLNVARLGDRETLLRFLEALGVDM